MKPILFNTDMVRAILEDRKTVTRRVVKPQPNMFSLRDGIKLPYRPGDILYVRETWQEVYETEFDADAPGSCVNIRTLIQNFDSIPKIEAGISTNCSCAAMKPRMKYYVFKASDIEYADQQNKLVWRPSIHMPCEAARIFLRVTDARVERLQDITEEQARAEGLYKGWSATETSSMAATAKQAFMWVWDSTIKLTDRALYGWIASPWVWVIEFERCEKPESD